MKKQVLFVRRFLTDGLKESDMQVMGVNDSPLHLFLETYKDTDMIKNVVEVLKLFTSKMTETEFNGTTRFYAPISQFDIKKATGISDSNDIYELMSTLYKFHFLYRRADGDIEPNFLGEIYDDMHKRHYKVRKNIFEIPFAEGDEYGMFKRMCLLLGDNSFSVERYLISSGNEKLQYLSEGYVDLDNIPSELEGDKHIEMLVKARSIITDAIECHGFIAEYEIVDVLTIYYRSKAWNIDKLKTFRTFFLETLELHSIRAFTTFTKAFPEGSTIRVSSTVYYKGDKLD